MNEFRIYRSIDITLLLLQMIPNWTVWYFIICASVLSHLVSQVRIGMDLTKVTLPTFILERRSLLEMYADFFSHADLFARWVRRFLYIIKYSLSSNRHFSKRIWITVIVIVTILPASNIALYFRRPCYAKPYSKCTIILAYKFFLQYRGSGHSWKANGRSGPVVLVCVPRGPKRRSSQETI